MARFFGAVGYGETVEVTSGRWDDVITEVEYYGDVIRNSRTLQEGDKVNDDISLDNSISIVADAYANEHIFAMRYVRWAGTLWKISNVEVQRPRLILRLGGVYNGPVASGSAESPTGDGS
jgi:hypothetical protein